MAHSVVDICNRALQILGAGRITSLTEGTQTANECNVAYEPARDAELRAHLWGFAITRAQIPALSTAPLFGPPRQYPLPTDCLRLLPPSDTYLDWIIEGRSILTYDTSPLDIRYVKLVTDTSQMDPLFREALSARIAWDLAEVLTQSNSKREAAAERYTQAVRRARQVSAFEQLPDEGPVDTWIAARL